MDLTPQEWDCWNSSWAKYKRNDRPTEHHDCKYLLPCDCDCVYNPWVCFSPEFKKTAYDDGLGDDHTLDKKQFHKEVR